MNVIHIPRMLTIPQFLAECKGSGITENAIRELIHTNQIVYIKAGKKYLINFEKFVEFLNNPPKPKQPQHPAFNAAAQIRAVK